MLLTYFQVLHPKNGSKTFLLFDSAAESRGRLVQVITDLANDPSVSETIRIAISQWAPAVADAANDMGEVAMNA